MKVIENIKTIRKSKGISHEAMAANLGISQATYTKIEQEETKLTVERLQNIADILGVSIGELLEPESQLQHRETQLSEFVAEVSLQKMESLYQENRRIYEQLIACKNEQIALLRGLAGKEVTAGIPASKEQIALLLRLAEKEGCAETSVE